MSPLNNINVPIAIDADGNVSTDIQDVLKLSQTLRIKTALAITNFGMSPPTESKDVNALNSLLGGLDTSVQTTRKLDIEADAVANTQAEVEAFKHFQQLARGKDLYGADQNQPRKDPYEIDESALPDVDTNPGEFVQGEQPLNPDDYLADR